MSEGRPGQFEEIFTQIAPLFGRAEARRHALTYIEGLLLPLERKSAEPIARTVGGGRVSGLQKFLANAPWDAGAVFREVRRHFVERLFRDHRSSLGLAVLDYGFAKKGRDSVGVGLQRTSPIGRVANCQAGVFLVGLTPDAGVLLDAQLYLPKTWCADTEAVRQMRRKTRVPQGVAFKTKAGIALDLLNRSMDEHALTPRWIIAGDPFGECGALLEGLASLGRRYLVKVRADRSGRPLELPSDAPGEPLSSAHSEIQPNPGEERFATILHQTRTPTGTSWLWVRSCTDTAGVPRSYYLSNCGPEIPRDERAEATDLERRGVRTLGIADEHFGMSHYETRSWVGWHHHMALVAVAMLLTLTAERDRSRLFPLDQSPGDDHWQKPKPSDTS